MFRVALVLLTAIACAGRSGPRVASLGPLTVKPALDAKPGVTQAGVHRNVTPTLLRKGRWDKNGWSLVLQSPGAQGLRLHFTDTNLREGELMVRASDGAVQTFKGSGPNDDGEFWTGLILGDSVTVELRSKRTAELPFRIPELSHLWTLP